MVNGVGQNVVNTLNGFDQLRESRNESKADLKDSQARLKRSKNLLQGQKLLGKHLNGLLDNERTQNTLRPRQSFLPRPAGGMASSIATPALAATPLLTPDIATGGPSGALADSALNLNQASATAGADVMDTSMQQMAQVMQMQMRQQTEMALMKLVVSMNEALAKELKKAGESVKNLAG